MWFTALGVRFSRCDFACRVQDAKLPCWPAYTDVPDAGAEIIAKTILGFPYYNCIVLNIPPDPILIIKAPRLLVIIPCWGVAGRGGRLYVTSYGFHLLSLFGES